MARTLFTPTTIGSAVQRLGFVQADSIRAPARAQDLTLRHQVRDYRAEDLERELKLALQGARECWPGVEVDDVRWHGPEGEDPRSRRHLLDDELRCSHHSIPSSGTGCTSICCGAGNTASRPVPLR